MTEAVIRNQSIDLQSKSMDWFLYNNGLRHERVKADGPFMDSSRARKGVEIITSLIPKTCSTVSCETDIPLL